MSVDGFWMAARQVTNDEYADSSPRPATARWPNGRWIRTTSRVRRPRTCNPGSMVFNRTRGPVDLRHLSQWWSWTPGASLAAAGGPGSSLVGRGRHPVVQIAYEDAAAYADWAGRSLPTEAEWEAAARGGLEASTYAWGADPEPAGERLANYWHGDFPWRPAPGTGTPGRGILPGQRVRAVRHGRQRVGVDDRLVRRRHRGTRTHPVLPAPEPPRTRGRGSFDPAQPQFPTPGR